MVGTMLKFSTTEAAAADTTAEELQVAPHSPVGLSPRHLQLFMAVLQVLTYIPPLVRHMLRNHCPMEVEGHSCFGTDRALVLFSCEEAPTAQALLKRVARTAEKLLELVRVEPAQKAIMAVSNCL
mmetsp:Transcript_133680/g.266722  ORF Transcript_133680/g.266722 Transcript_133680/m.266722 type:complete len:125 (-) Transcript_133680:819-1193(-)